MFINSNILLKNIMFSSQTNAQLKLQKNLRFKNFFKISKVNYSTILFKINPNMIEKDLEFISFLNKETLELFYKSESLKQWRICHNYYATDSVFAIRVTYRCVNKERSGLSDFQKRTLSFDCSYKPNDMIGVYEMDHEVFNDYIQSFCPLRCSLNLLDFLNIFLQLEGNKTLAFEGSKYLQENLITYLDTNFSHLNLIVREFHEGSRIKLKALSYTYFQTGIPPQKGIIIPRKGISTPLKENVTPLKENVTPLKENVTPLKETVTALKENVTARKENVTARKENVTARKENVTARKEKVTPRKGISTPLKENITARKEKVTPRTKPLKSSSKKVMCRAKRSVEQKIAIVTPKVTELKRQGFSMSQITRKLNLRRNGLDFLDAIKSILER